MGEQTATLKLKELVCHPDGTPMKQVEKVKSHTKPDPSDPKRQIPKSGQEILEEAPPLTRGELLSGILMNGIVPENAQEAAELNRLSKKVNNLMVKSGEWKVDMETIEKLLKLIAKVPMTQGVQLTLGDITDMLEQAKVEAFTKKHKDEVLAS